MPIGVKDTTVTKWRNNISKGHSATWLATVITLWAIGVVLFSWWLAAHEVKATKFILAGILLYEVLP